jgi:hypothetical protein
MIVMMIVVTGAVRAEPVFSFDATPGKLPKTVVPISYSIELRPDAESLALPGVEVIDIEVREPTARLTLNAVNTTVMATEGAISKMLLPIPMPCCVTCRTLYWPTGNTAPIPALKCGAIFMSSASRT